jgi:hypothetical protein
MTRKCGVANRQVNNKFHLKAYICRLKSHVVLYIFRVHAQILASTKLYVLAMDVS